MNVKRYLGASLALFIFVFFYEWLVHGVLLMNTYHQTAALWRTQHDMAALMPLGFVFQIIGAAWATFAFTKFYKNGGVKNGVTFGILLGVLAGIWASSTYIWMPIPAMLAWSWFFACAIKFLIGGAIIGYIYHKK